jgi:peptidyl-prolyl cis-trans isomerase C
LLTGPTVASQFFNLNGEWLDIKLNKIKCSHILVKKQSEAIAILERLKKGESFANLAKELSNDKGSAKRGGDLGLFGRGMMVRPFDEAAFKLERRNNAATSQDRIWLSYN